MPVGRDEIIAAVLPAAADLFAERGPAATSIREIAVRSRVNHGLVFRHFGVKEELVKAVLDYLVAARAELVRGGAPVSEMARADDRHVLVIARTLLDGYPAGQLQTDFPRALQQLEEVQAGRDGDRSARLALAHTFALQFGWCLFGPFVRAATGVELTAAEQRRAVDIEVARILHRGRS